MEVVSHAGIAMEPGNNLFGLTPAGFVGDLAGTVRVGIAPGVTGWVSTNQSHLQRLAVGKLSRMFKISLEKRGTA